MERFENAQNRFTEGCVCDTQSSNRKIHHKQELLLCCSADVFFQAQTRARRVDEVHALLVEKEKRLESPRIFFDVGSKEGGFPIMMIWPQNSDQSSNVSTFIVSFTKKHNNQRKILKRKYFLSSNSGSIVNVFKGETPKWKKEEVVDVVISGLINSGNTWKEREVFRCENGYKYLEREECNEEFNSKKRIMKRDLKFLREENKPINNDNIEIIKRNKNLDQLFYGLESCYQFFNTSIDLKLMNFNRINKKKLRKFSQKLLYLKCKRDSFNRNILLNFLFLGMINIVKFCFEIGYKKDWVDSFGNNYRHYLEYFGFVKESEWLKREGIDEKENFFGIKPKELRGIFEKRSFYFL